MEDITKQQTATEAIKPVETSFLDFYQPDAQTKYDSPFVLATEAVKSQKLSQENFNSLMGGLNKKKFNALASIGAGISDAVESTISLPQNLIESTKLALKDVDWVFPDMTQEERDKMAENIVMHRKARDYAKAEEAQASGTDNWLRNITSMVVDCFVFQMGAAKAGFTAGARIASKLGKAAETAQKVGAIGGKVAAGGLVGSRIFADSTYQYALDSYEKAGYDMSKVKTDTDAMLALANAGVQSFIAGTLGVEQIVNNTVQKFVEKGVKNLITKSAFKEGVEEFLQEETDYLFNTTAGHENRTFLEGLTDALSGAVTAACIGGAGSALAYRMNKSKIAKQFQEMGYDVNTSNSIAESLITETKTPVLEEMNTTSQLHNAYGESFNILYNQVKSAYETINANVSDEYIKTEAQFLANTIITQARDKGIDTKTYLVNFVKDNLTVAENGIFLKPIADPVSELKNVQAEIAKLNRQPKVDNTKRKTELNDRAKILKALIDKKGLSQKTERYNNRKKQAQVDKEMLAKNDSALSKRIESIPEAPYSDDMNKYSYVGGRRVAMDYEVVSAKTINQSHINGEENPNYQNKNLQNRLRGNQIDNAILQERAGHFIPEYLLKAVDTSTGAPVVNEKGDIVAGNGRAEVLARVRQTNPEGYERYKELLGKNGYNIEGIEDPILIRRVQGLTDDQYEAIAEVSNQRTTSEFNHANQALNDAKLFNRGQLTKPLDLLASLPNTEKQIYTNATGGIDELALDRRFKDAVMARILGAEEFENLVLSGKIKQSTINSITNAVKQGLFNIANDNREFRIIEDLRIALTKSANTNKANFKDVVMQTDIQEETEGTNTFNSSAMLYQMTFGTQAQLTEYLLDYANTSVTNKEAKTGLFSKDTPVMTQEDIAKTSLMNIARQAGMLDSNGVIKDENSDLKAVWFTDTKIDNNTIAKQQMDEERLFQSQLTSKISSLFSPLKQDISNFKNKISDLFRGNLKGGNMIQVVSSTPTVYKSIGMEDKPINITQNVIKKINVGKHNISQNTIENLPNLISDPILVLDSKTVPGSFVSVLDDVDNNGDRIVAIIKPLNGKFHIIPSVYGKTELNNLIETSNKRYINEEKASSVIDLSRLQLPRGDNKGRPITKSVIQEENIVKSDNDNIYHQGSSARYSGYFDKGLGVIVLGSNTRKGTLAHEISHFYLDTAFQMYKNQEGTAEFTKKFEAIAELLGINPDQDSLTTDQQEQWATMTEAYLFGLGTPDSQQPLLKDFLQWVPAQYQAIEDIKYTDPVTGEIKNPILSKEAMDIFDNLYALHWTETSPMQDVFTNQTNNNSEVIPANRDIASKRAEILTNKEAAEPGVKSQVDMMEFAKDVGEDTSKKLWDSLGGTTPAETTDKKSQVNVGRGTNTQQQMKSAAESFIKNNPVHAKRLIETSLSDIRDGLFQNDSGISPTVLFLTYAEMNKANLSQQAYNDIILKAEMLRSLAGKESGLTNYHKSMFLDAYSFILNQKMQKTALAKYGKVDNALELLNADLTKSAEYWTSRILNTAVDSNERQAVLKEMAADMKNKFDIDNAEVLFQEDFSDMQAAKNKEYIMLKARNIAKKFAGETLGESERARLFALADMAQKSMSRGDFNSDNPDVVKRACEALYNYRQELDKYTLEPDSVQKMIGGWLPSAMLFNVPTLLSNEASNGISWIAQKIANRMYYGDNIVDTKLIETAKKNYQDIYNATGVNLASINLIGDNTLVGGEYKMQKPSEMTGLQYSMRALSWRDTAYRNSMFFDTLARMASKDAHGNPAEANRLFKEYLKIGDTTESSSLKRQEAVYSGALATFTQDTSFARVMTDIRRALDRVNVTFNKVVKTDKNGNIIKDAKGNPVYTTQAVFGDKNARGLGTILMPFVKTPANVIYLGAEAITNPFIALGKKIVSGGDYTYTFKDWHSTMNLGVSLMAFAGALALGGQYEDKKNKYDAKGDSIVIGGIRVKLGLFGPLAQPLRQALTIWNYSTGRSKDLINTGLSDLPGFSAIDDLQTLRDDPTRFALNTAGNMLSQTIPGAARATLKGVGDLYLEDYQTSNKYLKPFARPFGLAKTKNKIEDVSEAFARLIVGSNIQAK